MAIDTVLLCKDCKFSKMSFGNTIFTLGGLVGTKGFMYKCSKTFKPAHDELDFVTGPERIGANMSYCEVERKHGDCGPTGKYWTPKYKKDLFKMLTKEYND
jgi:hypothetical protein